jgi:hypothetical protein
MATDTASLVGDLQAQVAALQTRLDALSAVQASLTQQISVLTAALERAYKGKVVGVDETGYTVTFPAPYNSAESYMPVVWGVSADGLRIVDVRLELTAGSMTMYPAEDDTTVYWRVEEL